MAPEPHEAGTTAAFDEFSNDYEEALNEGLALSGEDSEYFARGRVSWLAERLDELGVTPRTVLDYGCGTGSTVPLLLDMPGVERVVATDESPRLLRRGEESHGGDRTTFQPLSVALDGEVDVAYCNGVFHHIAPAARPTAVAFLMRALRPGGVLALWENNPWNPGTRIIMRRIPFDRDAILVRPASARRMLRAAGAEIVRTDFTFFFPAVLRPLRPVERRLHALPLGAQFLVLARKPG